jgi:hypothetical protein
MALELKGLLMPFMLCFERFVVATLERERGKERAGVNHSHGLSLAARLATGLFQRKVQSRQWRRW